MPFVIIVVLIAIVLVVAVGTAIGILLVAAAIGSLTYLLLLGLRDTSFERRLGISVGVAGVTTGGWLYYSFGGWGLVFVGVCVAISLAMLIME